MVMGPGWYEDRQSGCQYWAGPHVITAATENLGWGRWRDEEGDHYLPPAPGMPICAGAKPSWVDPIGEVCIDDDQRAMHVTSEAIAVAFVAPFMLYLAWQKELPTWARAVSFGIGVGTLAVDGALLVKYLRK